MVELIGVDALMRTLDDYEAIRNEEYEIAALHGMNVVTSRAAEYPDVPPGSRYLRTLTLKAGWFELDMNWQPRPDGFDATTTNPTYYGPYVMGGSEDSPQQTASHSIYWKTTDIILEESEDEIVQGFDDATERIVKRLGG